ncbi:MAG: hypothetical protein ACOX0A_00095 [Thermoguttaceae bacterium]|jgi:hypothetical protein
MNQEVNVLALVKGEERYVFLYTAENREEILETFGRYASDPEMSLTWYDAAVLTRKMLREKRDAELLTERKRMRKRTAQRKKTFDPTLFKNSPYPFSDSDEI